jgi:transcriptional regulator with XRE-family HTH domain
MASDDLPAAVARRRIRLALREARESRELTQAQVAEAMEWSHSKVMRIETGEVSISPNDLRPLLSFLDITDRARVGELLADARVARRGKQWWDDPRFRGHMTLAMRRLIQYETEAKAVREFNTMVIPGRFQTPAYAEAILSAYREELSDRDIEIRLEARMRRRTELLARKNWPDIRLLLDESVLLRSIGGPKVLAEQLHEIAKLAREKKRVLIRLLSFFQIDAPPPTFGAFEILSFADEDDAVVYRESYLHDEIVEDKRNVMRHKHMFDKLWAAALDERTSVQLIEERAKSAVAGHDSPITGASG